MFVKEVSLASFRNYEYGKVNFTPNTNIIVGDNAVGKTNILESIYYSSMARSHRFAKDNELINFSDDKAKIRIIFNKNNRDQKIEISFFKNKKKQIKLNNVPIEKTSDLIGQLFVVTFCPENLRLIKGSPGERRRIFDLSICQFGKKYFHYLSEFSKILDQKNRLLKDNPNSDTLWVWNEKLAEYGSHIIFFRNNYVNKLNSICDEIQYDISKEHLKIEYTTGVNIEDFSSPKIINEQFLNEMKKNEEREKKFGISLIGPNRDDFKIYIDEKEAKFFASQGQQRTASISVKMAELRLLKEYLGDYPVLLLDDVLSEIDEKRQDYIINNIMSAQVIITCTKTDKFNSLKNANIIDINKIKGK